MVAIQYRMGNSYPGEITRHTQMLVEPIVITEAGQSGVPTAFGIPLIRDAVSRKARAMLANDVVASVIGFLVRTYPSNSVSNDALDVSTPLTRPGAAASLLKTGYMAVRLGFGTAAADGQVFVRQTVNGARAIGDIEASSDVAAVAAAKSGGNTGNGTISAVTTNLASKPGVYQVRFTAATVFSVVDPDGFTIRGGTTGVAYADDVGFTITAGGTPFVAGDGFDITVTQGNAPLPGAFFTGPAAVGTIAEIRYRL